MRTLNHSDGTTMRLAKNTAHSFAMNSAIALYNLDAVYSYIPKNACSTLRWSSAISNCLCTENGDVNWINKNNGTFAPSLEFSAKASYAFVVLRCPFRRLASAFLDKVVSGKSSARRLILGKYYRLAKPFSQHFSDTLTFSGFCSVIARRQSDTLDGHWRPQSHFLLYTHYDDYFCVEEFEKAEKKLNEIGLQIFDTRKQLKHNSSRFEPVEGDYSSTSCKELRAMQKNGIAPSYASLFDDDSRKIVDAVYKDDIDLFKEKFGTKNMLFI